MLQRGKEYLYRDLHNGEVLPHIFNCPCRWIVQEETIEPVGFHIAQWIKVEDRLPEYEKDVLAAGYFPFSTEWDIFFMRRTADDNVVIDANNHFAIIGGVRVTHWMPIVPPKED